jgi:hypothetical protein
VQTSVGVARVPATTAAEIREVGALLDSLPAGPLFVSGAAPGWHLVSGRRNPTRFDLIHNGIGVTEPEVSRLLADLRSDPPVVVIVQRGFGAGWAQEKLWPEIGGSFELRYATRDRRWEIHVVEADHAGTAAKNR